MSSPAKRVKLDTITSELQKCRLTKAEDITKFNFNMKRTQLLCGDKKSVKTTGRGGILYYMRRDQRIQDNWALLFAQKLALENKLKLSILTGTDKNWEVQREATRRYLEFTVGGLKEVAEEAKDLNIGFHYLSNFTSKKLAEFVVEHDVNCLVVDFSPLRKPLRIVEKIKTAMEEMENKPVLYQVDAHNIVPIWETSEKQEYAARTIRRKIMDKLSSYLTEFPPVTLHPYGDTNQEGTNHTTKPVNWEYILSNTECCEKVKPVSWAQPGSIAGFEMLESFVEKRLKIYATKRNDPNAKALSNLSPWFHFGHLSAQRAVLYVKKHGKSYSESVSGFVEESVVRRELSDNFCFYNDKYDSIEGASQWAQDTLKQHNADKREYVYTLKEFNSARTHDDLWNAAQLQLITEGKLHGFMRMYWAKKILEWTESAEQALEFSLIFNDRYSLDGADPNGFVGCMWSVAGIHDQGWKEREVFGKIRFMNYAGCKRKFDIGSYIRRYGGKVHTKNGKSDSKKAMDKLFSKKESKKEPMKESTKEPIKSPKNEKKTKN